MLLPTIKRLGVTVMPEYVQSEGISQILTNIHDTLGATSITTSPYVAQESAEGIGYREPPDDGGAGKLRLLERPLWGKKEVWMETAPSFEPDPNSYRKSPYVPDSATKLTHQQGGQIRQLFIAAKDKGLGTYLQIMAAIPPCYRVQFGGPRPEDQPMLPSGKPLPARVDKNASLASSGLRDYMRGLITDLCNSYPECDGFKFDWPEYPPYHFDSLFADYNPQVTPYASELGIDLQNLATAMSRMCPNGMLRSLILNDVPISEVITHFRDSTPEFEDHFRLREHLTLSYVRFLAETVAECSNGTKTIFLQGFPPPWNSLSGFAPAKLAPFADEIAIKFYTMHWPMIGENYVSHLGDRVNLKPAYLNAYFRKHFMGAAAAPDTLQYPGPSEPHNVGASAIAQKVTEFSHAGVIGISHTYGSVDDVCNRFRALAEATNGHVELNRYAYMTDEKIAALAVAYARGPRHV